MRLEIPALIPYLTAGWPDEAGFLAAARGARRAGCAVLEVGIPFSDPIADGPVIQHTSQQALEAGITPARALALSQRVAEEMDLAVVAMTYTNLVWRRGPEAFMAELAEHGVQGLIVPDLPLEEGAPVEAAARGQGVDLVYLCAPTTPPERRREIATRTRGFLYAVTVAGVTGERATYPPDLGAFLEDLRASSPVPVCAGFGVSTPEQAAWLGKRVDGVIVGSALLRRLEGLDAGSCEEAAFQFLHSLSEALPRTAAR